MGLLWFLVAGVIAGWLAGKLVKGGGFGLIGGFLFSTLGVSAGGGLLGSILVATIGAVVQLFLVNFIKR